MKSRKTTVLLLAITRIFTLSLIIDSLSMSSTVYTFVFRFLLPDVQCTHCSLERARGS